MLQNFISKYPAKLILLLIGLLSGILSTIWLVGLEAQLQYSSSLFFYFPYLIFGFILSIFFYFYFIEQKHISLKTVAWIIVYTVSLLIIKFGAALLVPFSWIFFGFEFNPLVIFLINLSLIPALLLQVYTIHSLFRKLPLEVFVLIPFGVYFLVSVLSLADFFKGPFYFIIWQITVAVLFGWALDYGKSKANLMKAANSFFKE